MSQLQTQDLGVLFVSVLLRAELFERAHRRSHARHQFRIALLIPGRFVEAPTERLEIARQVRP